MRSTSNVQQKLASLYRDTYAPIMRNIEEALTMGLTRGNQWIAFDVSDLVRGDAQNQADVAMKMVQCGNLELSR